MAVSISLAIALAAIAGLAQAAPAPPREAVERGRQIAQRNCTGCHEIGLGGSSPNAAAPPFASLAHRYPADSLDEAFQNGLLTRHPAMPQFRFTRPELVDLTAYLKFLRLRPQTEAADRYAPQPVTMR